MFLGKFECNIDAKLRVSVPPQFRALLAKEEFNGLVAYPSLRPNVQAIEASGMGYMQELNERVKKLDEFSEEQEMAEMIFASSHSLQMDAAGRIAMPPELLEFAGIDKKILFTGIGEKFQLWEPTKFERYRATKMERARRERISLRPSASPVAAAD